MNRVSSTYRKSKKFLTEDIWKIDIEELSRFKASAVKYTKILILTLKTFSAQKIGFQAVALSFFGTMSVVPFIAVTFVVTGGLGISDRLKELLYANFSDNQNVIDMVLGFADNIITTDDDVGGKGIQQRLESPQVQELLQEVLILCPDTRHFPVHHHAVLFRIDHLLESPGKHRAGHQIHGDFLILPRMGHILYNRHTHLLGHVQVYPERKGHV